MTEIRAYGCENCGKGVQFVNRVSHAKNRMHTFRRPNLHTARLVLGGEKVKTRLCTKCLRSAKKVMKVLGEETAAAAAK
jgi:large subunit ribosomal protein L28